MLRGTPVPGKRGVCLLNRTISDFDDCQSKRLICINVDPTPQKSKHGTCAVWSVEIFFQNFVNCVREVIERFTTYSAPSGWQVVGVCRRWTDCPFRPWATGDCAKVIRRTAEMQVSKETATGKKRPPRQRPQRRPWRKTTTSRRWHPADRLPRCWKSHNPPVSLRKFWRRILAVTWASWATGWPWLTHQIRATDCGCRCGIAPLSWHR